MARPSKRRKTELSSTITQSSLKLNELPPELLCLIFDRLPFKDIIQCRDVCKDFKVACDLMKVKDVIVSDFVDNKGYSYPDYKLIDYMDSINLQVLNSQILNFNLNVSLLRLHLNLKFDCILEQVTKIFKNLELLDVNNSQGSNQVIKSNSLKILKIGCPSLFDTNRTKLSLITPNLRTLKLASLNLVTIDHKDSIESLELNSYEQQIESFKNLQYLQVNRVTGLNKEVLKIFENLKRFVIFENPNSCFFHHGESSPNGLRDLFVFILEQRVALSRLDFAIYFQGIQMLDANVVKEYDLRKLSSLEFQMANYNLLNDHLQIFDEINYSSLIKFGNIPDNFFKKFSFIRVVITSEAISSPVLFIEFLKKLNFLNSLKLSEPKADQSFYNQLTELSLTYLTITQSDEANFKFDFLLKMKELKVLQADLNFPNQFDLAIMCFKKSKKISHFTFTNQYGKRISISKIGSASELKECEYEIAFSNANGNNLSSLRRSKTGFNFNTLVTVCGYLKDKNFIMTRNRSNIIKTQLNPE